MDQPWRVGSPLSPPPDRGWTHGSSSEVSGEYEIRQWSVGPSQSRLSTSPSPHHREFGVCPRRSVGAGFRLALSVLGGNYRSPFRRISTSHPGMGSFTVSTQSGGYSTDVAMAKSVQKTPQRQRPSPSLHGGSSGSRSIDRDPQRATAEPSRMGDLLFVFQSIGRGSSNTTTNKPLLPLGPFRCPGCRGFDGA